MPASKQQARLLRRNQTDAEKILWSHLRSRQLAGYKFRRQHPIGPFVVDFVCLAVSLIIELDGGQHASQIEADRRRSSFLENEGYRVLRFWNDEVLQNLESVLQSVLAMLEEMPLTLPLSQRERER